MPEEVNTAELQIAHVLFIDTVGYTKLSLDEQRDVFDRLNRIVRNVASFRAAEAAGQLMRLPTGDGMALIFYDNLESAAQCAVEIARTVAAPPALPLRMGIHSGPVSRVTDVNDQANAAGSGINTAQRVMSCGDAGHILTSKRVAEDLSERRFWRPCLHDIGWLEAKHRTRLELVNLYGEDFGNPALPVRCLELAEAAKKLTRQSRRRALIMAALALLLAAGLVFLRRSSSFRVRDKSIAVLPFINLGQNDQHIHVAGVVQDQILKDLSKVSDLKVVSRTSVMQYRTGVERNLREIANQLGVANVVEGSVECVGNQVRVTAQLIDARTDTHLWAESYDGDVSDVFRLESEMAEKIVGQLTNRLSPSEKAAIEKSPTTNLVAYDFYVRAQNLIERSVYSPNKEDLVGAIGLLEEAIRRDPEFAGAYYELAHAQDQMYVRNFDHTSARREAAGRAVEAVNRIEPGSGEAHLALAKHFYWGYLDYDRARAELLQARNTLPNNSLSFLLLGYVDRRQGRWSEAVSNLNRALELDPANPQTIFILQQLAKTYECLHDYPRLFTTLQQALALAPNDPTMRVEMAQSKLDANAETAPLRTVLSEVAAENGEAAKIFAYQRLVLALFERDPSAAATAAADLPAEGCNEEGIAFPRQWCVGQVSWLRGDAAGANATFVAGRAQLEPLIREQPDNGPALCGLAVLDAVLGRKKEAIEEGKRALLLCPIEKDSITGAVIKQYMAVIYAWSGEKDQAIAQLNAALKVPGYLSYGQLKLDPVWDPLRGDSRFEAIVRSLKPKSL